MAENKDDTRKKVLEGLKTSMSDDIMVEKDRGSLNGPVDFEAKWETLRAPIFDNTLLATSFSYLEITEEEVKTLMRNAYVECGVELK